MTSTPQGNTKEERIARILDAALEVLSEFSFEDATTEVIAGRSRLSKRDLYAHFPNKQALLMGVLVRETQNQDRTFREVLERSSKLRSLRAKLEMIGFALVEEMLSPTTGVLRRLVISEGLKQPFLGNLFFERSVAPRCKLIGEILASHQSASPVMKRGEFDRAAERFFSMVVYFPSIMTEIGMRAEWTEEGTRKHISGATEVFLRAYPAFL
jgi:AcrR family transcriptional regulator